MDDPLSETDPQHPSPTYEEALEELARLRRALESRPVIDVAKGILVGRLGCDPERAFRLLVAQSQHENRKLRDVAEELVAHSVRQRDGVGPGRGAGRA